MINITTIKFEETNSVFKFRKTTESHKNVTEWKTNKLTHFLLQEGTVLSFRECLHSIYQSYWSYSAKELGRAIKRFGQLNDEVVSSSSRGIFVIWHRHIGDQIIIYFSFISCDASSVVELLTAPNDQYGDKIRKLGVVLKTALSMDVLEYLKAHI